MASGILGSGRLGNFILGAFDTDEEAGLPGGNTLAMTVGASCSIVRTREVGSTLSLTQSARSHLIKITVGNELSVFTTVFDPITFTLIDVPSDSEGLRDGASVIMETSKDLGNILSLGQGATVYLVSATAIEVEGQNTLILTSGANTNIEGDAGNSLAMTQGALVDNNRPGGSTLVLTDGASVILIRPLSAGNTLVLGQGATYFLVHNCTENLYTPFVGSSTTGPTPPPSSLPTTSGTTGLRLQYPSSGPVTDEMILKGPNLGNGQRIVKSRISRESRGGSLIVYSDPIWPKFDTLVISISALNESQKADLLDFVEAHIGEEVKLIDNENRAWTGLVIPNDMFTQDGHCSYTASFEFEGSRV